VLGGHLRAAQFDDRNQLSTRIFRRDWPHEQWTAAEDFLKFSCTLLQLFFWPIRY
jgi:hypothetical protein